jgi:hypothetical protein
MLGRAIGKTAAIQDDQLSVFGEVLLVLPNDKVYARN